MDYGKMGVAGATMLAAAALTSPANAALAVLDTFVGNVGLSTDGIGVRNTTTGTVSAQAPVGSTVLAAWLYGVYSGNNSAPVTFDGNAINYDVNLPNGTACCGIGSRRADVTSIVKSVIDGGPGGVYDFDVVEGSAASAHDGTALVVVFENPLLPESTVGILDGFADVTGDTTSLNFADPLDPTEPGFFAEMYLGIGFSCNNQRSTVMVNGDLLSENAGNYDDGIPDPSTSSCSNGNLITVGSFDDPFSPDLPSYADDTEHYNLTPFIDNGDTSIVIDTINASQDDNIFLAAFYTSGRAGVNEEPPEEEPTTPGTDVPAPAGLPLLLLALGGLFMRRRFRG